MLLSIGLGDDGLAIKQNEMNNEIDSSFYQVSIDKDKLTLP